MDRKDMFDYGSVGVCIIMVIISFLAAHAGLV